MKATLDIPNAPVVPPNGNGSMPNAHAAAEVLDWDVRIELPPRRPQGTIQVQLVQGGRGRPIAVNEHGAD